MEENKNDPSIIEITPENNVSENIMPENAEQYSDPFLGGKETVDSYDIKYHLVEEYYPDTLSQKVSALLKEGWSLFGNTFGLVLPNINDKEKRETDRMRLFQPLIKYELKETRESSKTIKE